MLSSSYLLYDTLLTRRDAEGTPYAGGYFRVRFNFTEEFPAAPPKCTRLDPPSPTTVLSER